MVAVMMFFIQNACGTGWVIGYMSYFMQLAGMPVEQSFNATVGICGVMLVGNISGWFLIEWLGRRGTALYGTLVLCVCLFIIGILAVVKSSNALVVQVVFMGVWAFGMFVPVVSRCLMPQSLTNYSLSRNGRCRSLAYKLRERHILATNPHAIAMHHRQLSIC